MRSGEILLVEDNADDVEVALRAFRKHGLAEAVVVARDGDEALAWLRTHPALGGVHGPKVIFLDLKMPKVGGFDVLREVRANDDMRHVPVVVLSSSDHDRDVAESYRLGANSFVRKRTEPARPGEYLVEAARYWLTLNRAPRT